MTAIYFSPRPSVGRGRLFSGSCWLVVALWFCFAATSVRAESSALLTNDVVAFVGGEDVVVFQRNGYVETLLARQLPAHQLRFRNIAWEGDTAYEQPRDLNFPAWPEQLKRAGATVVVAQFGQTESLRGREALPAFTAAYGKLLDQFASPGRRLVLLSPTPFENPGGALPDLSFRNVDLGAYVAAIRELARTRHLQFVDLFTPLQGAARSRERLTRDGLHLNARGHWLAAREVAEQLGGGLRGPLPRLTEDRAFTSPEWEQLRRAIIEKNRYWFDYWRPQNWAFLNGDRTEQASSRDHRNSKIRWFPREMEEFLPLLSAAEAKVGGLAAQLKP